MTIRARLRRLGARFSRRLSGRARDEGSSTMLVLVTMTILSVVGTTALTASINTLKQVDRSEDWQAALAAAEAGVSDYLARLHRNDNYWRTFDCTNVAMRKRYPSNPPCSGWNSATKPTVSAPSKCTTPTSSTWVCWAKVPGSDRAYFHYDVDIVDTPTNGVVTLTSTGRVGDVTRTVQTRLRRDGFGEFLYYTKYESSDTQGLDTDEAPRCARYDWDPSSSQSRSRQCIVNGYAKNIFFVSGDRINGPLHSNDAILIQGSPRFRGTTTTSMPSCRPAEGYTPTERDCYLTASDKGIWPAASASPVFERGIAWRGELKPPESISDLRQYVTRGNANYSGGCLYTGPTRIKFLKPASSSATPKMQVWSKYNPSSPSLNTGCGSLTDLKSSSGAIVDVPQNKLILVQDVPVGQSAPATNDCKVNGGIGDGLPRASTEKVNGQFPYYDWNLTLAESNCRYGSVYIQGELKGRVTVAADNNVVVTGNLTYSGGETGLDALGLIASNSVKIFHPVRCTDFDARRSSSVPPDGTCKASDLANMSATTSAPGTLTNVTVSAAMLALQHSFTVQYHDQGAKLSNLKVFGSIAQLYRGPVGTGDGSSGTGYLKDYNFDTRLRFSPPPYFLDPVGAGWGQKTFGEVAPQY